MSIKPFHVLIGVGVAGGVFWLVTRSAKASTKGGAKATGAKGPKDTTQQVPSTSTTPVDSNRSAAELAAEQAAAVVAVGEGVVGAASSVLGYLQGLWGSDGDKATQEESNAADKAIEAAHDAADAISALWKTAGAKQNTLKYPQDTIPAPVEWVIKN